MNRTYRLTFLVGGYTFLVLTLFSALILGWTYTSSYAALQGEINRSFAQRHKTALSLFTEEVRFIDGYAKLAAGSERLFRAVSRGDFALAEGVLQAIREDHITAPDILFATDFHHTGLADVSRSGFQIEESLSDLVSQTPRLLMNTELVTVSGFGSSALVLVKAEEIIDSVSGRVTGFVYCGTLLENNYSLLRRTGELTSAEIVLLSHRDRVVATTDRKNSDLSLAILAHSAGSWSTDFSEALAGQTGYLVSTSFLGVGNSPPLVLSLGIRDSSFLNLRKDILIKSIIFFLLSLLLLLVYGIVIRRLSALPLRRLMEYSRRIENGEDPNLFPRGRIREFNLLGLRLQSLVNHIKAGEERLRQFTEATWEAIIIQKDGHFLAANDQFFSMFGYDRENDSDLFTSRDYLALMYQGESLETVLAHIDKDLQETYEVLATRKDGTQFPVEIRIRYIRSGGEDLRVAAIRDLTERKRMAELMIQTEKMMSVGGLAAGMAHEINNPLAGLIQTANVLQRRLGEDNPANLKAAQEARTTMAVIREYMSLRGIPDMLKDINQSGLRVASIVKNMLQFSRKEEAAKSSHSLENILDQALEIASTDYNLSRHYDFRSITIEKEYEKDLPMVLCEGGSIQQVFLNVLRNGSEALHEAHTPSPRIILRLKRDLLKPMVTVEIEDNGPGMDEPTKRRIFEPFFTTKPVGKGTGLGLSVSYFIITENHGGEMTVESSPGKGTRFIINLPGVTG